MAVWILGAITVLSLATAAGAVMWARREVEAARRESRRRISERVASVDPGRTAVKMALETIGKVRDHGLGGALRSSIEDLAGWAEVEQPDLHRIASRDGTVTILFSDIEDSTALNDRLGDGGWVRLLATHDSVVRDEVGEHDGHIVKSQGDGFMIAFAQAEEALRCAIGVQRRLASPPRRLRKTPIRVRIGVHTGRAVAKDGDLFGKNVAMAARVAAEAGGAQVLASETVEERCREHEDLVFSNPREVELKGLAGAHVVYEVLWASEDGNTP